MDLGKQRLIMKSPLVARAFMLLFLVSTTVFVYSAVPVVAYTKSNVTSSLSSFNTELFNLLRNQTNPVDRKIHFNKEFSSSFDRLLLDAKGITDEKKRASLRNRLLSGPAPKPDFISANRKQYFYYEACQAHACDTTRLGLLYDVQNKSMCAELKVDGATEYLGNPSPAEVVLFEQLKSPGGQ